MTGGARWFENTARCLIDLTEHDEQCVNYWRAEGFQIEVFAYPDGIRCYIETERLKHQFHLYPSDLHRFVQELYLRVMILMRDEDEEEDVHS